MTDPTAVSVVVSNLTDVALGNNANNPPGPWSTDPLYNSLGRPGTATATADDSINALYGPTQAIDGLYRIDSPTNGGWNGGTGNETQAYPWLPSDAPTAFNPVTDWLCVDLGAARTLAMIVIEGRYADRDAGAYTFQYTTSPSPVSNAGSTWTTIGTFIWTNPTPIGVDILPRLAFPFPAISNVTGVQLVYNRTNAAGVYIGNPNGVWGCAVEQLEAYGPFTTAPTIWTPPLGTNIYVTQTATFSVAAPGGTAFQWLKKGTNIVGATSSVYQIANAQPADAGNYSVVVSNALGSITSSVAVLSVTVPPNPVLIIQEATLVSWTNTPGYVLQESPTLSPPQWTTISNWTVNVSNLTETAISNNSNQVFRMFYP